MTYETFEHEADVGVRGIALTIEKAFEETAKAMFNVEVDIKKIKTIKKMKVEAKASNIEELFVEWLNALLAQASLHDMVFSSFKVKIKKNKTFILKAHASGEKLNPKKHNIKNEVKAATYSQLKVMQKKVKGKKQWIAQCVVDV